MAVRRAGPDWQQVRPSCSLPGVGEAPRGLALGLHALCPSQRPFSAPGSNATPKATDAMEPASVCALDVTCTIIPSDPPVGETAPRLTPISWTLRRFQSQCRIFEKPPPYFPASFRPSFCPPPRILLLKPKCHQVTCCPRASSRPRSHQAGSTLTLLPRGCALLF